MFQNETHKIGDRAFDLLLFLIENNDRVISKTEIFEKVWPGLVVEENNLTVQISVLRKVLGTDVIATFSGRGYRLLIDSIQNSATQNTPVGDLPLLEKPSIAVLPFLHMASDKTREFFTDGISEDITTELSRFRSFFVISRQSTFFFKDRVVDVRTVAQQLGVRYVVEGSVRIADARLRITAQLTDASAGRHVWAERFDGNLDELFDIQDEIVARISVAVAQGVELHEYHSLRIRPADWGAYEIAVEAYQMASDAYNISDLALPERSLARANEALAQDANSFMGLMAKVFSLWQMLHYNSAPNREVTSKEALATLDKLDSIEGNNSMVCTFRGMVFSETARLDLGIDYLRKAHQLNPNNIKAIGGLGLLSIFNGECEAAIEYLNLAVRLSPVDTWAWGQRTILSLAYSGLKDYKEALNQAKLAASLAPMVVNPRVVMAIAYVGLGDSSQAAEAMSRAIERSPSYIQKRLQEKISGQTFNETSGRILEFILEATLLVDRKLVPEPLQQLLCQIEAGKR